MKRTPPPSGSPSNSDLDRIDERVVPPGFALLRAEHARLESVYDSLQAAYRHGDWPDVQATWQVFEPALRAHMDLEERLAFPAFRATSPADASALLAEHAELRTLLDTLAIHIELHAVPLADAEELIRRLRAHGHHEELVLYPWVEAAMDSAALAGP